MPVAGQPRDAVAQRGLHDLEKSQLHGEVGTPGGDRLLHCAERLAPLGIARPMRKQHECGLLRISHEPPRVRSSFDPASRVRPVAQRLRPAPLYSPAICAMSCRATTSLGARGSLWAPLSSSSVTSLSSAPIACCARLATMSGTFLRRRLASALALRSWLSAAKPTHSGGRGRLATQARMSGLGTS